MRRFNEGCSVVPYLPKYQVQPADLDVRQINYLRHLNKELQAFEKRLLTQATELGVSLTERLEKGLIDESNFGCELTCYIKPTDPAYDEDADNVLCEFYVPVFTKNRAENLIGLDENWNLTHMNLPEVSFFETEKHCWLFHALLEHTELGLANILRIGSVWVDIAIDYQLYFDISDPDTPE